MHLPSTITKNWPLFLSGTFALAGAVILSAFLKWDGLSLTVKMADLTGLLAPLAFAATVVERAVEILISPWRDSEASKLQSTIDAIKARSPDPAASAQNTADLKAATDALDDYRGDTQRYAFAVSLTLSVLVAMAGVRAIGPFTDLAKLNNSTITPPAQHLFFLCVDVGLSAALLAGGADGIHSIVNAVTSFFDATADKAKT